jgi:hypothetical protein
MVHQSNAYFERCHSADYDPQIQSDLRQACWEAWLEHYTNGQPPEKVEYARRRVRALEEGITVPPLPGLPSSALDTSYTSSILVSTTEERPEEDRQSEAEAGAGTEGDLPTAEPTESEPTMGSTDGVRGGVCIPARTRCREACDIPSCHDACNAEYRTCMRGFY